MLSAGTCVKKAALKQEPTRREREQSLTISLLLSESCWKQIFKGLVLCPIQSSRVDFFFFPWVLKLSSCILEFSAGRMHQGITESAEVVAWLFPACRGCGWTDNGGGEGRLDLSHPGICSQFGACSWRASWRDVFL